MTTHRSCSSKTFLLFLVLSSFFLSVNCQFDRKKQKIAVEDWMNTLGEDDFDREMWPKLAQNKQPQYIFEFYCKKLGEVFMKNFAQVNFVLVGACDGTHDETIRDQFLPNENWYGVFVEPVPTNYKDLVVYLDEENVSSRSVTIQAAVTDKCETETVKMKLPNYEKKNPKAQHWLRRQIGSIADENDMTTLDKEWSIVEIPCKTAKDVVNEWVALDSDLKQQESGKLRSSSNLKKARVPRIHVLKIDAEGHDYKVLKSFLRPEVKAKDLPLLICYESKLMKENLPLARALMEERGYVFSDGDTNDGFAILRGVSK